MPGRAGVKCAGIEAGLCRPERVAGSPGIDNQEISYVSPEFPLDLLGPESVNVTDLLVGRELP